VSDTASRVVRVSGALVQAEPLAAGLNELVLVGQRQLLGEVVRLDGLRATIQVYEDTSGLATGEPVAATGTPLTAQLGPGLLGSILDGVGRPLLKLASASGDFIAPGTSAATLDPLVRWHFSPALQPGDHVEGGDQLGSVRENDLEHLIMVPPGITGTIEWIGSGLFTIQEPVARLTGGEPLFLAQRWPLRLPRPVAQRLPGERPLVTGQRVFDLLFPVAEGGTCIVPGGFGTGKTVIEQSLAKFAAADLVVFVGCGERGNEITELLHDFPQLVDPRSGRSLMERSVLVVNTSNMPVVAREASIYLGMTIAEYYRDMGRRVALMIDSISRWAEALRELGSRLQEMPGEEGYPTYLSSRLGQFLERAGRTRISGRPEREGSVTAIAAVSPPGGDFSEPVTQAALGVAGALWALDPTLAQRRHFPAVEWRTSFSLYVSAVRSWLAATVGPDWTAARGQLVELLEREAELHDIAALVGPEALEDRDRLLLAVAAAVREYVLRQNVFDPNDAMSSLEKTLALARTALAIHASAAEALRAGIPLSRIELDPAFRALAALRSAPPAQLGERASAALAAARAVGVQGREGGA
jgi:V/A-type H+-transporting ATPase subunit A